VVEKKLELARIDPPATLVFGDLTGTERADIVTLLQPLDGIEQLDYMILPDLFGGPDASVQCDPRHHPRHRCGDARRSISVPYTFCRKIWHAEIDVEGVRNR
jgi:hypothetical protein